MSEINVGQIRARVQAKFGDTSGAEVSGADVLNWINDGLLEIARRTQQPQASASTSTVVGQSVYSLTTFAADILRLRSVKYAGSVLEGMSMEDADTQFPDHERAGQGSGTPRWFWVWAEQITLWPAPDAVGTLKLFYVKRPAAVALDADVPGIPTHMHGDLVDYVVAQVYETVGDAPAAERRMGRFEQITRESAADAEWPVRDVYPHVSVSVDDSGWY